MAVIALEKLEDHLNCSICLDTYTNPKLLQCNHVYCQQCLVNLVIRDQQRQLLILTCPNCRQITPVPASGVAGLQAAFRVNKLLEIVEEQKKAVVSQKKAESASTSPTPHGNIAAVCSEHGGREVELYCNTCEKTICLKCIMKDEKHHSHDYEELSKAFERYQKDITLSLEPLERQLETIKKALQFSNERHDEIANQQATIEADIHSTVAQLHETLDIRKTELIDQLHRLTQTKLKSLAAQRDQIETTQAQLSSCLLFMRENLKTSNQGEALLMKSTTVRQVKELTTTFQPDMLEPYSEADMVLADLVNIATECRKYGLVVAANSADPSKCIATGKGLNIAVVEEKSTAMLQTMKYNNHLCDLSLNCFCCDLMSEMTGTSIRASVERIEQSQYKISYQPTIKGRHQLHIKVEGQHIRGSPFPVAVTSSVEKLSTPILTVSMVKVPMGVAVNQKGEVVVTEGGKGRHCVTVFCLSGERLRSFGTIKSGDQFLNPDGVAVDGDGNIFIADQVDHHIQKFSAQGYLLKEVSVRGNTDLYPRGIAFNMCNSKVYVTVGKDHVQILHSDLRPAGRFGKEGRGKGEFNNPQHIACDSTGNVYVIDRGNCRIQVFTAEGKFLRMFGRRGEGKGEMSEPQGVAIDPNGNVYISDYDTGCVSVFTSSGQLKTCLDIAERYSLRGLAVDSSGVLYVCDQKSSCIKLF